MIKINAKMFSVLIKLYYQIGMIAFMVVIASTPKEIIDFIFNNISCVKTLKISHQKHYGIYVCYMLKNGKWLPQH